MKAIGAIIVAAAVMVAGWFYWQRKQSGAEGSSPTSQARAASAVIETRSIRFAVTAAGDIGPAEQVSVRPEVNGKIEVLPVDVGDAVKSGQLLFKLDDRELQTQRQQEDKGVERSRLELGQAERNFQRAQQLYDAKLIAQELFDDARTRFDLAKNDLALKEKSLELILERLRKTEIKAPFDCTVLTRPVSVGQAVSGSGGFNSGTEILTIANLNDLIINAHINQADVTRLHVDQSVEVTIEAIPGLKLAGRVERLAPQSTLKNNIRGFAARILLKDVDKQVRPGMTANITIPVASAENVVAAPLAAVFTETNPETREIERYAWVKAGADWEKRAIRIGVSDYFFAEITLGLHAGDEVSLEDRTKSAGAPKPAPAKTAGGSGAISPTKSTVAHQTASR
jgi:HlyD family secretion protein